MYYRKIILRNILLWLVSIISTLAITIEYPIYIYERSGDFSNWCDIIINYLASISCMIKTTSLSDSLVFILILGFYHRIFNINEHQFKLMCFILSVLLSIFLLVGISYSQLDNWNLIFSFPIATIILLGYAPLIYAILSVIFQIPDLISAYGSLQFSRHFCSRLFYKYPFAISFGTICICWLPWLIAYCPGTVFPDGLGQLNCFFRVTPWNDHHPAFSTMLMGVCMIIGRMAGSDNWGILLYVGMQYLICAAIFAESICLMIRIKAPNIYIYICLAFYSFYTVWPAYAQCFIKDTLFFASVLLYIMHYSKILIFQNTEIKDITYFTIIGLLVCLLRKNGIYFIIFSVPFLVWHYRRNTQAKYYLLSGLIIILSFLFFSTVLLDKLNILKGGTQEALSIPFQQTARYIRDYPDEVTEEEKAAIDGVLDYDSLANIYVPEISDPVKGTYHWAYETAVDNPGEKEALKNYFYAWFQGLFKHPDSYIQATLNNIYGYFYPDETSGDAQAGYYYITEDPVVDHGFFDIEFINDIPKVRDALKYLAENMRKLPMIGLLYSSGSWVWLLFILGGFYIYRRKWKLLYITIPYFALILICCASPVNGCLRYILPLIASMPWLIALFIKSTDLY